MQLFLIRHCPTGRAAGTLIGATDLPCRIDRQRLARLAVRLGEVSTWFCSPMLRARQTMTALQELGCCPGECVLEPRLREMDFGDWEGMSFAEIAASDPEVVQSWLDFEHLCFPRGESVAAFAQRCREMLTMVQKQQEKRVAVVTHAGVIRIMICLALGLPLSSYLLFQVDAPSLTVIELHSQGGVLAGLNI